MRQAQCALASGWDNPCLGQNWTLDRVLSEKEIAHEFYVWNDGDSHDWPTGRRVAAEYVYGQGLRD